MFNSFHATSGFIGEQEEDMFLYIIRSMYLLYTRLRMQYRKKSMKIKENIFVLIYTVLVHVCRYVNTRILDCI